MMTERARPFRGEQPAASVRSFRVAGVSALALAAAVLLTACDGSGGKGGSGDDDCGTRGCKLTASDAAAADLFGASVAVADDVIVVGATGHDDAGSASGSAYVFRFNGTGWDEEEKLTASDAVAVDLFGLSVAASGDVIVVGAEGDDDAGLNSGSAYVFRFDGTDWDEEEKFAASDAAAADVFGVSVSVSGDVIVVGAPQNDDDGSNSGSAYVFRFNGTDWIEEEKLTASDAAALDLFGRSVAVSDDVVVVGASRNDDDGSNSGSAYVFRFNGTGWDEEEKLTVSVAAAEDFFGLSVAVSDDVIVVGATGRDDAGSDTGSAHVFRFNGTGWDEEEELTASGAAALDLFGLSVAVSGDVIVVGAEGDDDVDLNSGSAHVFRFDGIDWVEEEDLTASDAAAADLFGASVAISGDVIVVGASRNDDNGSTSGAAYVFEF